MFGKIAKALLISLFFLSLTFNLAVAQEKGVTIYFFWSKTCPHCAKERVFLEKLAPEDPRIRVEAHEVSQPEANQLLKKAGEILGIDTRYIPLTIIGSQYFVGYLNDQTTGQQIKKAVEDALAHGCSDIFKQNTVSTPCPTGSLQDKSTIPETIDLPILGKIKTQDVSLPFLTIVIGILDGFNPCAMWTLLFLISLLLGMKDKKRMWFLGTAFIVTSALVYFLFMTAWLNLFLFLGFVFWVRIAIGLIALGAGGYNLREYWVNKEAVCKVTNNKKRQKVFGKLRKITQKKEFLLVLLGIILLAIAVNMVELVCSAGLPAVYTQVLALNPLSTWQYYSYLFLYILFYMIDDLFVFFAAMITLHTVGLDSKYARYSHLIGGTLMLLIGLLMLFKPELLMFG